MYRFNAIGLSLLLTALSAVGAQESRKTKPSDDPRWLPFVGCWSRTADASSATQFTCVKPGTGSSADILTIANGVIDSREHLTVDGQPHPIDKDGCTGSETATWASSGNRVYIGSAYTCGGNLHGRSTRMFAILPNGVWLEVRDVHSGGGWVETVTRFHDAGLPAAVPADIRSEISHRELAIATARAAASAPASSSDVAEAARSVDTAVVQSWLSARGQAFVRDESVAATQPNAIHVYEGSTAPSPAAAPPAEMVDTGCDPFGCYAPNIYSSYNGTVFSPYARPYGFGYPAYYGGFIAPIVIVHGRPARGRPPVIHPLPGHGPIGRPFGHTPVGGSPPPRRPTTPVVNSPHVGLQSRGRP